MFAGIKENYQKLNNTILNITQMRFFNEIYAGLLAGLTIFGWKFNSTIGMLLMIIVATLALLLTKNLKYVIPNCIYFIFMFNNGFANNSLPIPILIFGGLFAIIICIFSFKDGFHLKKMKSLLGLAGLAITTIIPIIWCRAPEGNEVFYFLFFGNLGYLVLYLIMTNGIKGNSIDLLSVTMSYLIVILFCECALKVYELKDTVNSILELWYYLGWGLCNEAGIMICISIPFAFYLLGKQEKLSGMIFQNIKIVLALLGILLTTSRGSYLFGLLEIGILYIVLMFTAKKTRVYQNAFFVYVLLILLTLVCFKDDFSKLIHDIVKLVFTQNLDDNGRKELWEIGYNAWKNTPLTKIFGPGIICRTYETNTAGGWQLVPIVFHSTFFETLAAGGLIGLFFLIIHFIEKYRNLYKFDKFLFIILGIGYFIVDVYGMIDNTYHMYYYMLPLMVIMAVIDNGLYYGKEIKDSLPDK